jgi:methionyl-tRNA formyltransferase
MNIVFFGTSEFAAIILEKMIHGGVAPVLVVTTMDKPAGRKNVLTPPPAKVLALKNNIEIVQPQKVSDINSQLQAMDPDLIVLASYGNIVPKTTLRIPTYGAINVHPSLLPKYRGASPMQSAILAGEQETGVSIMLMDEEMDHGPILAQQIVFMDKEAYEQLHNKLAQIGADLLLETIPQWVNEEIKPKEQNHAEATFTERFTREDGRIDWKRPVEYIERQTRAFTPWPGAYTFWKEKRIKILKAHIEENSLIIDELQLEGKQPTSFSEFKLGHPDFYVGP